MSNKSISGARRFATVHEALASHAIADPNHVALMDPNGRSLTYAQLRDAVAERAAALRAAGIQPGERVALVAKNSSQSVVGYLAILNLIKIKKER